MNARVRKKKKKLFHLISSELSHYNPNNLIVMGSGVMNNEIIRKKMGPIKGITRHLEQQLNPSRLVMIDEHKSSSVCAKCHGPLRGCDSQGKEARYQRFLRNFVTEKRKKKRQSRSTAALPVPSAPPVPPAPPDPPDPPDRLERKSNQAAAPNIVFRGTRFTLKGSSESYSRILYCPQCQICVHRDGNAARNMLYCYLFASVFDGRRPQSFNKETNVSTSPSQVEYLGVENASHQGDSDMSPTLSEVEDTDVNMNMNSDSSQHAIAPQAP
jgi:hypothetical protein